MNKAKVLNWITVAGGILAVVAIVSVKAFYFGFHYYEDTRPDGRYRIVVSHVPSLLDIQAVPPGDSADKYVWVRLYAKDGTKLNETLTLLNSVSEKVWGDDAVFVTGDLVWEIPQTE